MRKAAFALVLAILIPPIAFSYTPDSGFKDSPHDFSTGAAGGPGSGQSYDGQASGACTYCHTPHRAIQTKLLWNHKLSANTFAWTDTTTTVGGTVFPTIDTAWKGPSKFCLSCHDGSVAIGDINWFNKTNTWTTAGSTVKHTRSGAPADWANIANGASMNGNHPVAFPYPNWGGFPSTGYNGKATGATVYRADFNTDPVTLGIRLFKDVGGEISAIASGDTATTVGIECTSCHAVHNEKTISGAKMLLRGALDGNTSVGGTGGYICMKCHTR